MKEERKDEQREEGRGRKKEGGSCGPVSMLPSPPYWYVLDPRFA